jgi:hypothetical protein
MRQLICALVLVSFTSVAPHAVSADASEPEQVYDTVDAIDHFGDRTRIRVTGIKAGDSAATTQMYSITNDLNTEACERFALLAMSKPGKYTFSVVNPTGIQIGFCKLTAKH